MESGQPSTIRAVVRAVDGDEALVEVEHGGCGRCHEKGGCGGQQLTQMFCHGPKSYRVQTAPGIEAGDQVLVAIADGAVRETANLAYGVPLLATLGGAMAGMAIGGDLAAISGALLALCGAFFMVRRQARRALGNLAARPYIVSRSN